MSKHAQKGPGRRLTVEEVAASRRWTVATAGRYMSQMLRVVPAPGEPMTVTEASLERWLDQNAMRPIGPSMTLPVSLSAEHN